MGTMWVPWAGAAEPMTSQAYASVRRQENTCTFEHMCENPEVSLQCQPSDTVSDIVHLLVETGSNVGLSSSSRLGWLAREPWTSVEIPLQACSSVPGID